MSKSSLNAVKRHNNIFEEIKESTLNLIKDKFEYLDIYPQFSYQNFQNSNVNYLDFLHEVINLHKDLIYPYSCYNKNYHNKVNEKIKAKKFYNFVDVLSLQPVEVSSNWDTEQTLSNLLIKKLAWSPKGVTNPDDCKEYFIFKTLYPLCIIQAFEISFQKYSYAPNDINGCESIRISIGLTTDDFYFISDIIPLKKTFNKQMFNFQNILIIGSYIKVEFFKPYTIWSKKEDNELLKIKHKKYFKDADNLFYIAVGSFYVYGLEIREDKDELHPKYSKIRKILFKTYTFNSNL